MDHQKEEEVGHPEVPAVPVAAEGEPLVAAAAEEEVVLPAAATVQGSAKVQGGERQRPVDARLVAAPETATAEMEVATEMMDPKIPMKKLRTQCV